MRAWCCAMCCGDSFLQVMEDKRIACFGCNALQLTLCAQPCAITERVRSHISSSLVRALRGRVRPLEGHAPSQ